MDDILDILVENAMNERLDKIVAKDELLNEYDQQYKVLNSELNKIFLKEEDKKIISRLLEVQTAYGARYAELAYRQSACDVVSLLKSIKVIPETVL